MRTMGLKTRSRIGKKMFATIDAKPVTRAGASFGRTGKISTSFVRERMKRAWNIFRCARFEDDIDAICLWRPNTKVRFVGAD